jgi:hypothetical protein
MSDFHLWQLEKIKKTRKPNPEPMEIEPESQGKDPNQQKKEEELANLVKRYFLSYSYSPNLFCSISIQNNY